MVFDRASYRWRQTWELPDGRRFSAMVVGTESNADRAEQDLQGERDRFLAREGVPAGTPTKEVD